MKLNAIQWLWMGGVAILAASLLLDLANVVNVAPLYMLLGSAFLLASGWWVMPSIKELEQPRRRRS
jgi:hypothetical protein